MRPNWYGLHESILALPGRIRYARFGSCLFAGAVPASLYRAGHCGLAGDLLLDEITANLDSDTEQRVLDALGRAAEGRTVLSISHRLQEHVNGQRIIRIGGQL